MSNQKYTLEFAPVMHCERGRWIIAGQDWNGKGKKVKSGKVKG